MNSITLISSAGDEENPEIKDPERDLGGLFGIFFPRFFKHIDIISGWFYETSDEPDTIYIALKVKELKNKELRTIYSVHWEYKGKEYATGIHTYSKGEYFIAFTGCMEMGNETLYEIDAYYDLDKNIITWIVPKEYIGDPEPGEILDLPFSWNGIRFIEDKWIELYMKLFNESELAKDWALGEAYTIQF
jgi:hypothetical protein